MQVRQLLSIPGEMAGRKGQAREEFAALLNLLLPNIATTGDKQSKSIDIPANAAEDNVVSNQVSPLPFVRGRPSADLIQIEDSQESVCAKGRDYLAAFHGGKESSVESLSERDAEPLVCWENSHFLPGPGRSPQDSVRALTEQPGAETDVPRLAKGGADQGYVISPHTHVIDLVSLDGHGDIWGQAENNGSGQQPADPSQLNPDQKPHEDIAATGKQRKGQDKGLDIAEDRRQNPGMAHDNGQKPEIYEVRVDECVPSGEDGYVPLLRTVFPAKARAIQSAPTHDQQITAVQTDTMPTPEKSDPLLVQPSPTEQWHRSGSHSHQRQVEPKYNRDVNISPGAEPVPGPFGSAGKSASTSAIVNHVSPGIDSPKPGSGKLPDWDGSINIMDDCKISRTRKEIGTQPNFDHLQNGLDTIPEGRGSWRAMSDRLAQQVTAKEQQVSHVSEQPDSSLLHRQGAAKAHDQSSSRPSQTVETPATLFRSDELDSPQFESPFRLGQVTVQVEQISNDGEKSEVPVQEVDNTDFRNREGKSEQAEEAVANSPQKEQLLLRTVQTVETTATENEPVKPLSPREFVRLLQYSRGTSSSLPKRVVMHLDPPALGQVTLLVHQEQGGFAARILIPTGVPQQHVWDLVQRLQTLAGSADVVLRFDQPKPSANRKSVKNQANARYHASASGGAKLQ